MKKLLSFLILSLSGSALLAQLNFKIIQKDKDSNIVFASFSKPPTDKPEVVLKQLNNCNSCEYRIVRSFSDDMGFVHTSYQQYYNSYKVRYADFVVHTKNNIIEYLNGHYGNIADIENKKLITEDQAKANAIKFIKEKISVGIDIDIKTPGATKVLSFDAIKNDKRYRYAYEISTNISKYSIIVISGEDGEILDYESSVCTTNEAGTGATLYSGNRNIVADRVNPTTVRLREVRNNVNVNILNMQGINDFENTGAAVDFIDNDNNWTQAEHGNNIAAIDVKWAVENILDYWRTVHNRNSYNNAGATVNCYVHVTFPAAIGQDNAIWHNQLHVLEFADGQFISSPLVSLDIVAHEFAHGVCQFTSNLTYGTAESGALNEGFSDIWGATVEAWTDPNKQRWLIGEETWQVPPFFLRSMSNPNAGWLQSSPDTYNGNFWASSSDPHFRSGVLNYWYFLLSDGGSGTNDLGNNFNVDGIGINNAARIAYRTEQLLNSGADYAMARTMSIQAATELFGNCSNELVQVTNAWYAVGVGSVYVNQTYDIYPTFGQDCSQITLGNASIPAGTSITWFTDNGLLVNGNSSPYTSQANPVVITSPSGSSGNISASAGAGCSIEPFTFCPCSSWDASITWIYSTPMTGEPLIAEVSPAFPDAQAYRWYVNGELIETTYGTFLQTYNWPCVFEGEGLYVIAESSCGITTPIYGGNYSPICSGRMASNVNLYPNPASSQVTIILEYLRITDSKDKMSTTQITLKEITQIRVIDRLGVVRKVIRPGKGNKKTTINVWDLPPDIYYLDISDDTQHVRKPLIIRR
jgi:Zn-dependent metalloprotease